EVLGRIQQAARHKQHIGKIGIEELPSAATGPVQDEHGIAHHAGWVALRRPERHVVNANLRKRFAARELEIARDPLAFLRRRIIRAASNRGRYEKEDRQSKLGAETTR